MRPPLRLSRGHRKAPLSVILLGAHPSATDRRAGPGGQEPERCSDCQELCVDASVSERDLTYAEEVLSTE